MTDHAQLASSSLVRWPEAARMGRVIPKRQLAGRSAAPTALRTALTEDVEQIRWAYSLSPALMGLGGTAAVPEFVIVEIDLRADDLPADVLTLIDRAIPHVTVLELARDGVAGRESRMVAFPRERAGSTAKVPMAAGPWEAATAARRPLPAAADLELLYLAVLAPILPVMCPHGARVSQVAATMREADHLDRQITQLESRMRREAQFNRRVELHRELRSLQAARTALEVVPGPDAR